MSHPYRYLALSNNLHSIGESVPGTGEVSADVNVHCFIGSNSDGACRICIGPGNVLYIGHTEVVYRYFGPSSVCIGSGGSGGKYPHYVTLPTDWVPTGTTSHEALSGRNTVDQHLASAITGLVAHQAQQDSRLTALETEVARLEQDKLNISDGIAIFSWAGYAALQAPSDSVFPNLGGTWQKLDILTLSPVAARSIVVDPVNSTFAFQHDGVYVLSSSGTFAHNSSNAGRTTQIRLYNETTDVGGSGIVLGTGRNAEATALSFSILVQITEAMKGQIFSVEIGNGDTYSAVSFQALSTVFYNVGEWQEPI